MTMNDLLININDRIEELKEDLKEEPNPNQNHLASMIMGEIDGLVWIKELIEEHET